MLHGFLNIDKPLGWTSHDAVGLLRRLAGQRRVGHGGTLDPLATGVLPIALGYATRLLEYLVEEGRKVYRGEVRLGVSTTTDDAEGEIIEQRPLPLLDADRLRQTLERFSGWFWQVPPRYSAIQIGGRRMYELARKGEAVEIPARQVFVERIDLLEWQPPTLTIAVVCGKGTYIRSLARDIGEALGCGGHLQALRRTAVGALEIGSAVALEQLRAEPERLAQSLLPLEAAVADWQRIDADQRLATDILHGKRIELALPAEQQRARVHGPGGELLAVVQREEELWRPVKVFPISGPETPHGRSSTGD